jgi:transcriptional regulator with GAF, ATPase, and Fis domain
MSAFSQMARSLPGKKRIGQNHATPCTPEILCFLLEKKRGDWQNLHHMAGKTVIFKKLSHLTDADMSTPAQYLSNENLFFRQATSRICGSLDLDIGLARFLNFIQEYMPADAVSVSVYDADQNLWRSYAFAGLASLQARSRLIPFPEDLWQAFLDMLKGEPGIERINDLHSANPLYLLAYRKVWGDDFNVSLLAMDLALDDKWLGLIIIHARGKHRYGDEHARLLTLLHEPCAIAMANCIQHQEVLRLKEMLKDDNRFLQQQLRHLSGDTIIGADFGLRPVMQLVRQVASTHSPVLLLGETGVGKEVIANAIHSISSRKDGPFIKVNCGAIPESLMDSELFGHEKGAFTGATERHRGRFERAHGGTIFLDEVGELPPQAQIRLLRVLQNREIERVGGNHPVAVDVRVISATHRDLQAMVDQERFRKDLWFRLNVFPIRIPPLRDRKEDIPTLLHFFLEHKSRDLKVVRPEGLMPGALDRLMQYNWPGNVRELQNVVERELILRQGEWLRFDEVGHKKRQGPSPLAHPVSAGVMPLDDAQRWAIRAALETTGGKVEGAGGAAELLNIHPSTLRARMRKLGLAFGRRQQETIIHSRSE